LFKTHLKYFFRLKKKAVMPKINF